MAGNYYDVEIEEADVVERDEAKTSIGRRILRHRPIQAMVAALVLAGGLLAALTANTSAPTGSKSLAASCTGYTGTTCPPTAGFWMLGGDGGVFPFGNALFFGAGRASAARAVAIVSTPDGGGYWVIGIDGLIRHFGDAPPLNLTGLPGHTDLSGITLGAPIVGAAATPDGRGLWEVGGDGGTFTYGDAQPLHLTGKPGCDTLTSPPACADHGPIVAIAPYPFGDGAWLLASGGGVYSFNNAPSEGAGKGSPAPAVALVSDVDGRGYWVITKDGILAPHGDAPTLPLTGWAGHTSLAGANLLAPVVGGAATADGQGMWVDAGDGAEFTFGDAPDLDLAGAPGHNSLTAFHLDAPVDAIARAG